MNRILQFLREDDGPTAVEYAILLALLVGMMVSAITFVGNEFYGISEANKDALDTALNN